MIPSAQKVIPAADQLWRSRPPRSVLARVRSVMSNAEPPIIEYELLDDGDGLPLTPPLSSVLDAQWWRSFQPVVRRHG